MVACYGSSAWRWCRDTERPRFEGSCHGRGSDAVSAGFCEFRWRTRPFSHVAASASYSWLRDARRYCAMVLRDCVRIQPRRYGPGCHDTEGDACVLWTPDGAAGILCWVTDLPLVSYHLSIPWSHTVPVTCLSFIFPPSHPVYFLWCALLAPVCIWLWLFGRASACCVGCLVVFWQPLCICSNLQVYLGWFSWVCCDPAWDVGLWLCRVIVLVLVVVAVGYHYCSYC